MKCFELLNAKFRIAWKKCFPICNNPVYVAIIWIQWDFCNVWEKSILFRGSVKSQLDPSFPVCDHLQATSSDEHDHLLLVLLHLTYDWSFWRCFQQLEGLSKLHDISCLVPFVIRSYLQKTNVATKQGLDTSLHRGAPEAFLKYKMFNDPLHSWPIIREVAHL